MNHRLRSIVLLVGFAFAGCVQPTEPHHQPAAPTRERATTQSAAQAGATELLPFHLSTSVEASRTMVTGRFNVFQLAVRNHEREVVTIGFPMGCRLVYVVYDLHGNQVSLPIGCTAFPSHLMIGPGETVLQQTMWHPLRWDYDQHAFVPLPPGRYRIHAYLDRHGYLSPPFVVRLVEQEPASRP